MKKLAILLLMVASIGYAQAQERPDRGDGQRGDRGPQNGQRGGERGGFGGNTFVTDDGFAVIVSAERIDNGDDTFSVEASVSAYGAAGLAWQNELSGYEGRIGEFRNSGAMLAFTTTVLPTEEERDAGAEPTVTLVALNAATGAEAWQLALPGLGELRPDGNGGFFYTFAQRGETSITINLAYIVGGNMVYSETLRTVERPADDDGDGE